MDRRTLVLLTALLSLSVAEEVYMQSRSEELDSEVIYTVPFITYGDYKDLQRVRRSEHDEGFIDITLPTPGKDILLRLIPSESLLVPGATYEVRKGNVSTATPVRTDCYYQGKVVDVNESFAALSICDGLTGIYVYNDQQYSIQPVLLDKGEDNYQRLHSIRKMNKKGFEGLIDPTQELLGKGSRRKRDATEQKYLEVMVVIDQTVINFHGEENTEIFILALFNMINMIYGHSSLGVDIKLSLVKLVLLEEETADEMWEGDNPRATLDKFCMWSAVNSLREHEVGHYDFAMYLSRGRMTPAGYAPVTGMCRPDRSCALIKEDGFSTAFVAAHEIGHTIGMSHDGEGTNKCVNEPKRGSIMAPLVMANLNNYFWSPCSKEEIDSILSTLYCLRDNPFEVTWSHLEMPLGKNWDLDEQCEKEFGAGFQLCSRTTHNFSPCENLWCSTPGNRYLCKTKRAPPLPGSTCAKDRWCFNSQCIVANPDDPLWRDKSIEHSRLKSVDGSWSRWTSWSSCSTSCGRGIKSRTRTCDEPEPALGGRDCAGESYDLRLCNLPEQMTMVCKMFSTLSYSVRRACMKHKVYYRTCKTEIDDVRLDQCTRYNKRGRTYKPFEPEDEEDLCLLNCRTKEHNIPLYGEIEARDGTFCTYNDRNAMCYAGKCIPVGCDGKINSGAKEDMCGQCKGDNSKCTLRQDYYNEKLDRGYQLLIRLYPGTRNFRIKKPNDAYKLVLKNVKTNETILSERTRESFNVTDYGVLWNFSNTRSETLECSGPLQAEYDVIIYSVYSGMRATLSITFTEPLNVVRDSDQLTTTESSKQRASSHETIVKRKYTWTADEWGECSQPCGDGMHEQQLVCQNTRTNQTVHELLCKGEEKPNTIKKTCNLKPCDVRYRWVVSEWTKCPKDLCTIDRVSQRRWSFCVKESPELEVRWQRVKDSFCESIEPPVLIKPCNKSFCSEPGYWKTGHFSLCSKTCGRGLQIREVTCVPIKQSDSSNAQCDEQEKPSTSEVCMRRPCVSSISTTTTTTPQVDNQKSYVTALPLDPLTPSATTASSVNVEIHESHAVGGIFKEDAPPSYTAHIELHNTTARPTIAATTQTSTTKEAPMYQSLATAKAAMYTRKLLHDQELTPTATVETKDKVTTINNVSEKIMETITSTFDATTATDSTAAKPSPTKVTDYLMTTVDDPTTYKSTEVTNYATETSTFEITNRSPSKEYTSAESLTSTEYTISSNEVIDYDTTKQSITTRNTITHDQPSANSQSSTQLSTIDIQPSATTVTRSPWWWTTTTYAPTTNTPTIETPTTKFVWWWTAKTPSTARPPTRTKYIWWWTSPTTPAQAITTATANNVERNSRENVQPHVLPQGGDRLTRCDSDSSSICQLMDDSRCRLLLFKRLCCHSCLKFL